MKIRTVASCASLKSNASLMVGILEAHVEKQNPDRKKKMLKKIRCFVRASITLSLKPS
jgi:hypothetical protein